MTDFVALLAQARTEQERHYRTRFDECGFCCGGYPCPCRVFADAVISALEGLAARDTTVNQMSPQSSREGPDPHLDPEWLRRTHFPLDPAKDDA